MTIGFRTDADEPRVVVIGGGIAGLATALSLAPIPTTVITPAALETGSATAWAQGGIAAALGADDSPERHAIDTVAAGGGLAEPDIAERVAWEAGAGIEALTGWGVRFDRDIDGRLALGLEAAHSRRRIVHAGGDASGARFMTALARAARRTPSIEILEHFRAVDLVVDRGVITGVLGQRDGQLVQLSARAVVLATGGAGGLYASTTNPLGAIGSGFVLAARAGAVLRDVEFVQFHPTAIALGADPMPLASEAIRGEGAVLVNAAGERILADVPGAELAPRDVLAAALWREVEAGRPVFLDAREALGGRFPERFPRVTALCHAAGLDPVVSPIPVRPAAHYHMGGVRVDTRGRASVRGLWACGEVAATGLHGANRLASNSLLEAVVYARRIADDVRGWPAPSRRGLRAPRNHYDGDYSDAATDPFLLADCRRLMDASVGVVRHEAGLTAAVSRLSRIADDREQSASLRSFALAGLMIAAAALDRRESRGAHLRADYPTPAIEGARHADLTLADIRAIADAVVGDRDLAAAGR